MADEVPLKLTTGSPNRVERFATADTLAPARVGVTGGVVVGTTQIQTLTNKTAIDLRVDELWNGVSEAPSLAVTGTVGSQHNYLEVQNQTGGAAPRLSVHASSFSANCDLVLGTKGTGVVKVRYAGVAYEVVTLTTAQTLTNKTLTTPAIASMANAQHTHQNGAGGGTLTYDAFATGVGPARALYSAIADSAAIANTVTETAFSNLAYFTTPRTFALAQNAARRFTLSGKFSTTGTPTLRLRLRGLGSSATMWDSGAITTPSGVTNAQWSVALIMVSRDVTASGIVSWSTPTAVVMGSVETQLLSQNTSLDFVALEEAGTNIEVTATWGTASASNTIVCEQVLIEALN